MICDLLGAIVHEVGLGGNLSPSVLLRDANRCLLWRAKIAVLSRLRLISIVISFAQPQIISSKPMEDLFRGGIGIARRHHLLLCSRTGLPMNDRIRDGGVGDSTMLAVRESALDMLSSGTQAR